MKKHKPLSASRVKKLQECSWKYWTRYHLRLPDTTNDGALRGSICHLVFEWLGNKRHKKHYNNILKKGSIQGSRGVLRLVNKYANDVGINDPENMDLVDSMIVEGLYYDFFGENNGKPTESHDEIKFDIEEEDGRYRILGFIDKLFLFKKKKLAIIRDFKSSKRTFEGKDIEDNIQGLFYQLAVKHLYPDFLKRKMEFVFLKFDCSQTLDGETKALEVRNVTKPQSKEPDAGVILTPTMSDIETEGFEMYLEEIQKTVNGFTENDGKKDYAWDKGFTDGFGGKIMCGLKVTEPGQMKADGVTPAWFCPDKFAYHYYSLKNEEGKVVKNIRDKKEAEAELKEGWKLEKKFYAGCPKFSHLNYNRNMTRKENGDDDDFFL